MKVYKKVRRGYPDGVIGIYDNNGKTIDRYTVVFAPWMHEGRPVFNVLNMGGDVCMHGEYLHRPTRLRGERAIDWSELPTWCRQAVKSDLNWPADA